MQLFFCSFHHGFGWTLKIRNFCKKKVPIVIRNEIKIYVIQCNPLNIMELKAITVNFIEAFRIVNYFLQGKRFHFNVHLLDRDQNPKKILC